MKSKIYFGHVEHRRFEPKKNFFNYRLFMLYLDLDELPNLFDQFLFWSKDKFNLASFRSKNYLVDNKLDIKSGVRNEIEKQTGVVHLGPVRMLTHLSYFGYCFNPVTFYYCFDKQGDKVEFIVSQINNTPWNERFCYVIDNRNTFKKEAHQENVGTPGIECNFDKAFHVSPFLPMNMQYFWRFSNPDKKLNVYMKNTQEDNKIFDVKLMFKAKPITSYYLSKALLAYPLMTCQVVLKIYWQSLILFFKKVPFYENPKTMVSNKVKE